MKVFLFFLLGFFLAAQAIEEKDRIVLYTEEKANDTLFIHRVDIIEGYKKEAHFINGQPTTPGEYEEALLAAETEERRRERAHLQDTRLKTYDLYYKARSKIAKNELKPLVTTIEAETKKLADSRLKPFLIFSPQTIGSPEELQTITSTLIPQAYKLLEEPFEAANYGHFNHIKAEIGRVLPRIQDMCNATLDNAITKGDDTKLLKDILALFA
jgi:hypothetical protein